MTEATPVACPTCSSREVRTVREKPNLRPRLHTGNLLTDLTPISVTVTHKCQNPDCGQEWSTTTPSA